MSGCRAGRLSGYHVAMGGALLFLGAASFPRTKRERAGQTTPVAPRRALATAAVALLFPSVAFAAAPGLDAYRNNNYTEAYQQFEKTLRENPNTHARTRSSSTPARQHYKLGTTTIALEWFSRRSFPGLNRCSRRAITTSGRTRGAGRSRGKQRKGPGRHGKCAISLRWGRSSSIPTRTRQANLMEVKKKIRAPEAESAEADSAAEIAKRQEARQEGPAAKTGPEEGSNKKDQQQKKRPGSATGAIRRDEQSSSTQRTTRTETGAAPEESPPPRGDQEKKKPARLVSLPSPNKGTGWGLTREQGQPNKVKQEASPSPLLLPRRGSPSPSPG